MQEKKTKIPDLSLNQVSSNQNFGYLYKMFYTHIYVFVCMCIYISSLKLVGVL